MKTLRPTTPGQRGARVVEYRKLLSGDKPTKKLLKGAKKTGGRNNRGRITTRHKGAGVKRKHRSIDFLYDKKEIKSRVETVEYDPHRSGFIGVLLYADGERRYVLLPQGVRVGSSLIVSETATITPGNRLPLKNAPLGTYVFNVEIAPGQGAKLARSAGNYAEVLAKDAGYVDLKMPSGEIRKIIDTAWASVGEVSNPENRLKVLGKAGRSRRLGIRPTVRGMAMNPVDHPMGGGEGRGRGQRPKRKTKQGKLVTPGIKTRSPKKYSNRLIVKRRKTKRNK